MSKMLDMLCMTSCRMQHASAGETAWDSNLEVGSVGFTISVCSAWQDGLVVGGCLLGTVLSHHLCLAMPDGFQSLLLFWRQSLFTGSNCQTLHMCTPVLYRLNTMCVQYNVLGAHNIVSDQSTNVWPLLMSCRHLCLIKHLSYAVCVKPACNALRTAGLHR